MRTAKANARLADNMLWMMGERDMSQSELGRRAGITNGMVHRIVMCKKKQGPTLQTLCNIREAFGCSWDELLG